MDSFRRTRDIPLTIALSSKDSLQSSISAGKHGSEGSGAGGTVDLRSVLYGSINGVRTMCIHLNANMYSVSYLWYSMVTVYVRDVYQSYAYSSGEGQLTLSNEKLDLYVIDAQAIAASLDECMDRQMVQGVRVLGGSTVLTLVEPPHDIMVRCVRKSSANISEGDWEMRGTVGEIRTYFSGDKYLLLSPYCDVALCTDMSVVVRHLGKAKAAVLYRRYLREDNVDLYLSKMLTQGKGIYDYGTPHGSDTVKRMMVRSQVGTMVDAALEGSVDDLTSMESRLALGLSMRTTEDEDREDLD